MPTMNTSNAPTCGRGQHRLRSGRKSSHGGSRLAASTTGRQTGSARLVGGSPELPSGEARPQGPGMSHDRGVANRILLVDDDERIRASMRLVLEDEGYVVE